MICCNILILIKVKNHIVSKFARNSCLKQVLRHAARRQQIPGAQRFVQSMCANSNDPVAGPLGAKLAVLLSGQHVVQSVTRRTSDTPSTTCAPYTTNV